MCRVLHCRVKRIAAKTSPLLGSSQSRPLPLETSSANWMRRAKRIAAKTSALGLWRHRGNSFRYYTNCWRGRGHVHGESWWDFMYMDTWWEFLPAPPYRKANGGEGEVQTCRKTNEEEPGRASNGRTSWTVSNSWIVHDNLTSMRHSPLATAYFLSTNNVSPLPPVCPRPCCWIGPMNRMSSATGTAPWTLSRRRLNAQEGKYCCEDVSSRRR